jgi:hypothetical protein
MMKNRALAVFAVFALVAVLVSGGVAYAQQDSPWLHIRVTEAGEDGAKVNVNLPLSLVTVFADIAEEQLEKELSGHGNIDIDFDDHDIDIEDIRRAWGELRDAGDADFVEVQEDDEYVKISRSGNKILIQFDEDGDNKGRVEVPVSVVDALLDGDGQKLNLRAAIDELVSSTSGEIVLVEDGDTTVRIWIE